MMGTDQAALAPNNKKMKNKKQLVLFMEFSFSEVAIN